MSSEDLGYFRARADEEREKASVADSPPIRAIHFELAARYTQIAGQLSTTEELQSSRNAVRRSLQLLKKTAWAAADR